MTLSIFSDHLFIVIASMLLAVIIGIPLGIMSFLYPKCKKVILWIVDVLQTIPALALLGIIMVFFGAGKQTVIIGITLYSLLPIVRNTNLGLENVDPGVVEAAIGMGMSQMYRLVHIELPLASSVIFTGVRIATVNAVGSAVFAAFVGGGGIGKVIYQAIRIKDMKLLLTSTAVLMVIAIVLDLIMSIFEKHMKNDAVGKRSGRVKTIALKSLAVILSAAVIIVIGIGSFGGTTTKGKTIEAYDGMYSEERLVTEMVRLVVEEYTDLHVNIKEQMTQVNAFREMIADKPSADFVNSYDGTVLTTYLHLDTTDIPEGMSLYDFVNKTAMERHSVRLLGKIGTDNTYAIAVPTKIAEKYDLNTISDLVPVADKLVFGAEHDFFSREGSMKYDPFVAFYGIHFKDRVSVDISLKYTAVQNGNFDVVEVYATDGMNRKADLKILEDDKSFFPEYNGAVLVRDALFDEVRDVAPNLEEVINMLEGKFTNETMTDLTYAVDVEGRDVKDVAKEFLISEGILLR